jgi:hypothetical protein
MIYVVFIIKGNDEFNFITTSSIEVLEVVNYGVLFFQCLQVISNLISHPVDLEIIIESLSTKVEMNHFEIGRCLFALGHKVGKINLHKR